MDQRQISSRNCWFLQANNFEEGEFVEEGNDGGLLSFTRNHPHRLLGGGRTINGETNMRRYWTV